MDIKKFRIVSSIAGRDKGHYFIVIETEPNFVYLVDGKLRKVEAPKRKRLKHIKYAGELNAKLCEKLSSGDKVLNSEIRRALAEFTNITGNKAQQA